MQDDSHPNLVGKADGRKWLLWLNACMERLFLGQPFLVVVVPPAPAAVVQWKSRLCLLSRLLERLALPLMCFVDTARDNGEDDDKAAASVDSADLSKTQHRGETLLHVLAPEYLRDDMILYCDLSWRYCSFTKEELFSV